MKNRTIALGWILFPICLCPLARSQLAITEVMSSASTNLGPSEVVQNSDFWELTNFGTNAINLTGYKFDDADNNLAAADSAPFDGLSVGPGESVVFVQNSVNTNDVSFRAWWGTNLAQKVKVVFYNGNGFSSGGDGIRLWGPGAQNAADVIDSVDFGEAKRGASFTYDPVTGGFGVASTNGVDGAFKAEAADDVGSPGKSTGPTPITILQQPLDTVVNPGDAASFAVQVRGRPRGTLQWRFKDSPILGATNALLQLTNVQPNDVGTYSVLINNGVTTVQSRDAQLVLHSEAAAPVFTQAPDDLEMYVGQSYVFAATATGSPQPAYQWQKNGTDIDGATTPTFNLAGVSEADSGDYAVIARNAVAAVTNYFRVNITAKPQLVITEVLSSSSTNATGHGDWWELTNLGSFAVHLRGYRFDDNSEMLSAAFTITNDVSIPPGESIVFVESMTADEFRQWWGSEFLRPNLQIVTYRGNGLSSAGDAVNLWNRAASEDSDKMASAVFSTATAGVSFGYDPDASLFGGLSVAGTNGAFDAAEGGDIGSPGYTRNSQRVILPRIGQVAVAGGNLQVTWSSQAGKTYAIEAKGFLEEAAWTTVRSVTATASTTTLTQALTTGFVQQFYRVAQEP